MADDKQDILSQALLEFQDELTTFGKVQKALKSAHDELIRAEREWEKLTKEQQQTALELVSSTKDAVAATHAVTNQTESLAGALIPLAKAIEQVNFPMRLDKIDLGISTQASTMATFHGAIDRGFNGLNEEIEKNGHFISAGFISIEEAFAASRKRDIWIIALLILNALALIYGIVFFFKLWPR